LFIACVDDSRSVHAFLRDALSETGASLEHFYDGKAAVDAFSQEGCNVPDVLLLDWEMPVLAGIDALPLLKTRLPNTIILMATSKNSMSDIVDAIDKGASDYLMKPFTKGILIGKIEQHLGRKVA
jgi:DNA-binding response OmpR family regulator